MNISSRTIDRYEIKRHYERTVSLFELAQPILERETERAQWLGLEAWRETKYNGVK
jgi:hypothetical protein